MTAARLLVALSMAASGLGCLFEPWLASRPNPEFELFSIPALAGAALIAAAAGVAAGQKARRWASILGAAALMATIADGATPYRDVAAARDFAVRIALIGALPMLLGDARSKDGSASGWLRIGRRVFAIGAVVCTAGQAALSAGR